MGFPCRCRKCKRRKTLKRKLENYIRIPVCFCGNKEFTIDWYRYKKENKNPCKSGFCKLHFPHKFGSKGCYYYEDVLIERIYKGS